MASSKQPASPPRREFSPSNAQPGDIIYIKAPSEIPPSSRRFLTEAAFPSSKLDHPALVLQKSPSKKNSLLICTVASFEERTLALVEAQNAFEPPNSTSPSTQCNYSESSASSEVPKNLPQQPPAYIPIYPCRPLVRGTPQLTLETTLLPYPRYLNTTTIHTIPYALLRSFNPTTPISTYRLSAKSFALLLTLLQPSLDALEASSPPISPTPTLPIRSHSLPPRPALYGSSRPHRISPRPSFGSPGTSKSCGHNTVSGKLPTARTALLGQNRHGIGGHRGMTADTMANDRRQAQTEHWITVGVFLVFGALGLWMILFRR